MPDYRDDLRLAHVLADAADAATMDRFKALDLKVETKPDMTPVSEADKAAEELIRGHLHGHGRGTRSSARSTASRAPAPAAG
jgi:histidinol-phosphatase